MMVTALTRIISSALPKYNVPDNRTHDTQETEREDKRYPNLLFQRHLQ
jgi:hypothetical protein